MRLKYKVISFNTPNLLKDVNFSSLEELRDRITEGQAVVDDDLRLAGLAMAKVLINLRIEQGRIQEILDEASAESDSIGIVFKKVEGGSFKFQGKAAEIESFKLADTPFTIGQMKRLLELREEEVRAIFLDPEWNIDKVIQESLEIIADNVCTEERDKCPLVNVSQLEAQALAELLGYELPSEQQWERAAAGTDGLKRPWGDNLSKDKAVYKDTGTRPVKSKPKGKSVEGMYDLIGLVSEWTSSWYDSDQELMVLRSGGWIGGNFSILHAESRGYFRPDGRHGSFGFRISSK
ncbi:MAG: formylglycine-generating enzyme family protein [Candidatus Saganbacteria bacterium]|nr:formylglycine-generating enzyme family protein [Candidatus Saganbacteria bacterium]